MKLRLDYLIECILMAAGSGMFVGMSIRNQYVYQIASEKYNFTSNDSVQYCSADTNSSSVEEQIVGDEASRWQMYIALASGLPSVLSATLFTSWSDKVGRKIALFFPLFGYALSNLMLVFILMYSLPPYWVVISSFIYGLMGSFSAMLNICMAYISDITTKEQKTGRYTLVECSLGLGGIVTFGTGFWITGKGFLPSACLATVCSFAGVVLIPLLPAPPQKNVRVHYEDESETSSTDNCDTCNYENINRQNPRDVIARLKLTWRVYTTEYSACNICNIASDSYELTGCPHGGGIQKGRIWRIWFHLLAFNLFLYPIIGSTNIDTMYFVSYPSCFTPTFLGIRSGLIFASIGLAPFVVALWKSVLQWSNGSLIVVGMSSLFVMDIIVGFASKAYIVFASSSLYVFTQVTAPVIRSQISSLASDSEQGAALGLISGTETLTNMIANITYLLLYPVTLTIFHGFIWLYSSAILIVPIILETIVWVADKRRDASSLTEDQSPLVIS